MMQSVRSYIHTYRRHVYLWIVLLVCTVCLLFVRTMQIPTTTDRAVAIQNIRQSVIEQQMHGSAVEEKGIWSSIATEIATWW